MTEVRRGWRTRIPHTLQASVAATVAMAALAGGSLAAGTAMADGGGGAGGGNSGTIAGMSMNWSYHDENDGGWGGMTLDSYKRALAAIGVGYNNYNGNADRAANQAISEANAECVARFNAAHPGEVANCRMVAVGAVGTPGATPSYSGDGWAAANYWKQGWESATSVQQRHHNNNGEYYTSSPFSDAPNRSVDSIAAEQWNRNMQVVTIVIALNQYEPLGEQDYNLSVDTKAGNLSVQSGDTADATDTITLSRDRDVNENVTGTATLHWRGPDGTEKTASKLFTAANNGTVTVSASYRDMDASWEAWPAGDRWWDISIPKQGKMKAAASHLGEKDADESGTTIPTPPVKELYNAAGDKVEAPNDQIASGSLVTARISAQSNASGQFFLYDTIQVPAARVTLGAADADDLSKIHVEDAAGNTVDADISVDDSQDGKRIVKAHVKNPHSGKYTLVVPFAATPTGDDYDILDDSKACWAGDLLDCQDGDSREVGKVTPKPDKVWVLDKDGALNAEDPNWTNEVGADKKTFVAGDAIGAVVNGSIPAHLLNPLTSYSITDDWSPSAEWIDWSDAGKVSVIADGQDVTDEFDITVDEKAHTTTATAKKSYLAKTMLKTSATKIKLYVGGTIKAVDQSGAHIELTNKGSETWNNEKTPTNEPPVYITTPDPNKAWAKDETEAKDADDPDKTNQVASDTKTFVRGDSVSVTVNGKLPKNLARDLSAYEIGDDWTTDSAKVDLSDVKSVKVYIDGVDSTDQFDIHTEGTRTWASAKASLLKGSAERDTDRTVRMTINGRLKPEAVKDGQTVDVVNDGWEKWNQQSIPTNTPEIHEWAPNPDKSWILYRDGAWQTVIDPDETDKTGGDALTYLDGDLVGAVVNGTLASNLAKLDSLSLTDDWTDADYAWDPTSDLSSVRVYEQTVDTDSKSSAADIINTGQDVTDRFDIVMDGTHVTATAKADWLAEHVGLDSARQITLLVPGRINLADGGGAAQARTDFGKDPGDELTVCTDPDTGDKLANTGSQAVNDTVADANDPTLCVYIPPVEKQVIAEGSEGGDQDDANGKTVFPGQKVEYRLTTKPQLPDTLAYDITTVSVTDTYDPYLEPDVQTVEVVDLNTGNTISKKKYTTSWNSDAHSFTLDFDTEWVKKNWPAGSNPRIQVRFEGTVSKDAPTTQKVGNEWKLTLNNSITPSNRVENNPPETDTDKKDTQKDPSISIDGKTALLGDTLYYRVGIDAIRLTDTAYRVWRLGMVDDYDDEYLKLDVQNVQVLDDTGADVTDRFNVADIDGVVYAFAKLTDTYVDATGETVPGDPQPEDLAAYAALTDADHDPLHDPAIDQSLLGHRYEVVMPMTVIKVTDGYVVENTATQVTNDKRDVTNTVTNPLKPINPSKDVTVSVGGDSIDGGSVYKDHTFLYQLDSSILPADRAYAVITDWSGVDRLDTGHDEYTGQWAVYATRDLHKDGETVARTGERIAGSGYTSPLGELFTLDYEDGVVTVKATQAYLDLVSGDNAEAGWRLYLQCKRLKVADRVENTWTETMNGVDRPSNTVWTRTPDMTPSLSLEKWDTASGFPAGDRDDTKDALKMDGDSTQITFTITNTSKVDPDTGDGAWFKASDLDLTDTTLVGDAKIDMDSLVYPGDWDTLILKPGDSVQVTGTLKGVKEGESHTDRAVVTGTPLVECAPSNADPFDETTADDMDPEYLTGDMVQVGDRTLCADSEPVVSNTDDWNGRRPKPLAKTGVAAGGVGVMGALALAGATLAMIRRRTGRPAGRHTGR